VTVKRDSHSKPSLTGISWLCALYEIIPSRSTRWTIIGRSELFGSKFWFVRDVFWRSTCRFSGYLATYFVIFQHGQESPELSSISIIIKLNKIDECIFGNHSCKAIPIKHSAGFCSICHSSIFHTISTHNPATPSSSRTVPLSWLSVFPKPVESSKGCG
jgi:hypothetical protein